MNLREKLFLLSPRGRVRTRVSKSQKWSRINFFSKYGNFNVFEFDPPFDRSRRDKHFRLLFSSGNMTGSGSKSRLKIGLKIENRTSGCPILTFRPCINITRWGDSYKKKFSQIRQRKLELSKVAQIESGFQTGDWKYGEKTNFSKSDGFGLVRCSLTWAFTLLSLNP